MISFSTNPETAYAYFGGKTHDPKKSNTGQKLFVGNSVEMILRAIIDICDGTDTYIQKPHTGYQYIKTLSDMLNDNELMSKFIKQESVSLLLERLDKKDTAEDLMKKFIKRSDIISIGAYVISGNYAISRLIEDKYGTALAIALTNEEYVNVKSSSHNRFSMIIDRNARWYLENKHYIV